MTIKIADCDQCGTEIDVENGENLYTFDETHLCESCYSQMYEDMVPPETEEEEGYD